MATPEPASPETVDVLEAALAARSRFRSTARTLLAGRLSERQITDLFDAADDYAAELTEVAARTPPSQRERRAR